MLSSQPSHLSLFLLSPPRALLSCGWRWCWGLNLWCSCPSDCPSVCLRGQRALDSGWAACWPCHPHTLEVHVTRTRASLLTLAVGAQARPPQLMDRQQEGRIEDTRQGLPPPGCPVPHPVCIQAAPATRGSHQPASEACDPEPVLGQGRPRTSEKPGWVWQLLVAGADPLSGQKEAGTD